MRDNNILKLAMTWFVLFTLVMTMAPFESLMKQAEAASFGIVERVFTDKSRYSTGNTVVITSAMKNNTGAAWSGNVVLKVFYLETQVYTSTQAISLSNNQSLNVNFNWTAPATDYRGYFVRIDAGTAGQGATAVDVSSNFTKYPRYGYISEFPSSETAAQSTAMINQMSQDYHLNSWQLYDWMWRHEKLLKRTGGVIDATWQDLFNRTINWQTIKNQINSIHNVNGKAMAYAMIYAAREGYNLQGVDPTWGIYEDTLHASQLNVNFGGGTYMWLFDPQNTSWQNFMKTEFNDAVNSAGFDGIHVDQMGQRSNVHTYNGTSVDLSTRFTPFVNAAKTSLTTNNASKNTITYNIVDGTVNGWAVNDVSQNANVDFLYSEIWYLSNTYLQLKDYIESLRTNGNNKAVVLAAYMDYGENLGTSYEAESATKTNVTVNTNWPGYTGIGFVDGFAEVNDAVTFNINAPETGDYSLVFRAANGAGMANRNLYIDGVLNKTVLIEPTGGWGTWSHKTWAKVTLTAGNHTIKFAYDAANAGGINLDSLTLGTFNADSVILADAMMAASGATHLELGDANQMLPHEYYPDHSKSMRNYLKEAMKNHYNFITAYENLLFDADVITNDSGNQFLSIAGVATSGSAVGNTVWNIHKRTSNYDIVHLINLLNNDNDWRDSANTPTFKTNLATKVYIGNDETISNVYVASPDLNHGSTQSLTFTTGTDTNGKYVSFTVPNLNYWDMIYMKKTSTTPANDIYEAELAIKTNVTTNTNWPGYTGSGFADNFSAVNDGVSFIVKSAATGMKTLKFRYSNGGSNATKDLFVDGKFVGVVSFPATGGWGTWGYGQITANLSTGSHSAVLWYNGTNTGAINLDHLDID